MRPQRRGRVVGRRRHRLAQDLEQRLEVRRVRHRAVLRPVERCAAGPRRGVDDRELDLVLGRVQVQEQLVAGVDDLGDPRVRAVHLVDDDDHRQLGLERLAQHEPGLRQRSLAGIHQQDHAVDHGQAALDLAAEVGVPGRVDDVDGHAAVPDRGVLGQDRDALLPLQVAGVHDPIGHLRADPEGARLPEHGVDQRRLAVVDVRHDRDVAQVVAAWRAPTARAPVGRADRGPAVLVWAGLAGMRRGSGNCGKRRDYGLIAILVGRPGAARQRPSLASLAQRADHGRIRYRNPVRSALCSGRGSSMSRPDGPTASTRRAVPALSRPL